MLNVTNNSGRTIQKGETIYFPCVESGRPLEVVEVDGQLVARPYANLEELIMDHPELGHAVED